MKRLFTLLVASLTLTLAAAPSAAQTPMSAAQVQRRQQVRMMEDLLERSAQNGAEQLALKVREIDPNVVLLSGAPPRARGLVIDGHGVLFYLEVPGINPAIRLRMQMQGSDQATQAAIAAIRRGLQTVSNPQERFDLQLQLDRLEQRVLPPGVVRATPPGTVAAARSPVFENPDAEYERLVKDQLIETMLDYSQPLGLAADEWLTIAARGSEGPMETVVDDTVTVMLRIKGSDLADFRAGRITRDEARARVKVSEF